MKYVGQFVNGVKYGYGTMYFATGHNYTGEFKNGIGDGKGTVY